MSTVIPLQTTGRPRSQVSANGKESPFDPDNSVAYLAWREQKLEGYPADIGDLLVEVEDPRELSGAEYDAILSRCRKANMAIYSGKTGNDADRQIPALLGRRFGLTEMDCNMGADDDGITELKVVSGAWRGDYIPYSNRPIHWHTDGYYNEASRQIPGLQLHCVEPAAQGGANALLDHEIAYMHLRDTTPDYIRALMRQDAMTIPANGELRPARTGPVFSVLPDGSLHMRYTARTHSIEWSPDPLVNEAREALAAFLGSESPFIFHATLQPGQGLICNNVLHTRSGFSDSDQYTRKLYRLRYYQRISGT